MMKSGHSGSTTMSAWIDPPSPFSLLALFAEPAATGSYGVHIVTHEAIGILQRCCMSLHESVATLAASEVQPDAVASPRMSG